MSHEQTVLQFESSATNQKPSPQVCRATAESSSSPVSTLSQDALNITNKIRSNLFTWRGQFSPQLVEALLKAYAPKRGLVLDPFVGSGTVLCEAGRLGLRAFGTEINPAAANLAQVYTNINKTPRQRQDMLASLEKEIYSYLSPKTPLFSGGEVAKSEDDCGKHLIRLYDEIRQQDTCLANLMEILIITVDFYNKDIQYPNVVSKWKELKELIMGLPYSEEPIEVQIGDARQLPLDDGLVDTVITSPPYINVFNYHQQYRASMEAMGWKLLRVAKSEIGSNRKHRQNRFLTVIQYCLDMYDTLSELRRVCKESAQLIFVVGRESNVKKTAFFNGDIVDSIGTNCVGLRLDLKQERVFRNKFGQMIREDILHFSMNSSVTVDGLPRASDIATDVLKAAIERAPEESLADLYSAISSVNLVQPSPQFDYNRRD
jgi:hypothetical protein